MLVIGGTVLLSNDRIQSILVNGPVRGDPSSSARLIESLLPFAAGMRQPMYLLTGFGAGNISEAERIIRQSGDLLPGMGDLGGYYWWRTHFWHPDSITGTITMSAYSSFIGEFGLIGFMALTFIILRQVIQHRAWHKSTVFWLLLIMYLHVQFEGYSFYALPLFIWAVTAHGDTSNTAYHGIQHT